jgi:hypothetical protein
MNSARKQVSLTTLAEYINTELRRERTDVAGKYICYFNKISGLDLSSKDFQMHSFHSDLQHFVSLSRLQKQS